jgi:hypothetical protein
MLLLSLATDGPFCSQVIGFFSVNANAQNFGIACSAGLDLVCVYGLNAEVRGRRRLSLDGSASFARTAGRSEGPTLSMLFWNHPKWPR